MNRRTLLKSLIFSPLLLKATDFKDNKNLADYVENKFTINMRGDLDDDLIIIKSTEDKNIITDIHQMHNSKGTFKYEGNIYSIEHSAGYIMFNKEFKFKEDEVYTVCLANEREEAEYPITERFRTHYKNEKLLFNKEIFLKALMPEYNSVPDYPVWFNEGDVPRFNRTDENGNTYNYYHLFENTVVQIGIVFPNTGEVRIRLFNSLNELKYTFEEIIETTPKYLKSNELKENIISAHPFVEVNNILNLDVNNPIENKEYLTNMLIDYKDKSYNIKLPYPAMYPNLISVVAVQKGNR